MNCVNCGSIHQMELRILFGVQFLIKKSNGFENQPLLGSGSWGAFTLDVRDSKVESPNTMKILC
jgi:hypothetical protein